MKVEPSKIEKLVDSLEYKFHRIEGTTVTACWSFLPNGFQVGYGQSACLDPNNYDKTKGEHYAMERCLNDSIDKLWEMEGYHLRKLH